MYLSYKIALGKVSPSTLNTSKAAVFTFGPLKIHIYTEITLNLVLALGSLTYSIKRISLDERDRLPDRSLVINLLGLIKETLFKLPIDNSFYISY